MDPRKRDNLIYVAVVGSAVAFLLYFSGIGSIGAREFPLEGEVTAVENVGVVGNVEVKEAVVRLESGRTVRASIPRACVVLPGQVATIFYSGRPFSLEPEYTVLSSKEKG